MYQAITSILPNLISGTSASLKKIGEATASNSSPDKNDASPYTKSSLRDFFTVLALSFHAVFEGLAIGLEPDSKDVWLLFAGKVLFLFSFIIIIAFMALVEVYHNSFLYF